MRTRKSQASWECLKGFPVVTQQERLLQWACNWGISRACNFEAWVTLNVNQVIWSWNCFCWHVHSPWSAHVNTAIIFSNNETTPPPITLPDKIPTTKSTLIIGQKGSDAEKMKDRSTKNTHYLEDKTGNFLGHLNTMRLKSVFLNHIQCLPQLEIKKRGMWKSKSPMWICCGSFVQNLCNYIVLMYK